MKLLKIIFCIVLFLGMSCVLFSQTPYERNVVVTTKGGHGTGIIVYQDMVLTCFHNLCVDSDIKVNGKVAKIIKVDPKNDLCLLYIKTPDKTTPLVFCKDFAPMEEVVCIGNPLDHRGVLLMGHIFDFKRNFIYTDTHILPGFSGGGMYNAKGQLLGMVVAMEGIKGAGYPYGMAVPASSIVKFLMEQ